MAEEMKKNNYDDVDKQYKENFSYLTIRKTIKKLIQNFSEENVLNYFIDSEQKERNRREIVKYTYPLLFLSPQILSQEAKKIARTLDEKQIKWIFQYAQQYSIYQIMEEYILYKTENYESDFLRCMNANSAAVKFSGIDEYLKKYKSLPRIQERFIAMYRFIACNSRTIKKEPAIKLAEVVRKYLKITPSTSDLFVDLVKNEKISEEYFRFMKEYFNEQGIKALISHMNTSKVSPKRIDRIVEIIFSQKEEVREKVKDDIEVERWIELVRENLETDFESTIEQWGNLLRKFSIVGVCRRGHKKEWVQILWNQVLSQEYKIEKNYRIKMNFQDFVIEVDDPDINQSIGQFLDGQLDTLYADQSSLFAHWSGVLLPLFDIHLSTESKKEERMKKVWMGIRCASHLSSLEEKVKQSPLRDALVEDKVNQILQNKQLFETEDMLQFLLKYLRLEKHESLFLKIMDTNIPSLLRICHRIINEEIFAWNKLNDGSIEQYLKILDLPESNRDFTIVKSQYKRLARQYHPDVTKDDGERFKKIREAYEKISKILNVS